MNKNKKTGFTLIELLVTIVIIGILASMGIATYENQAEKARIAKQQAEDYQLCMETLAACVLAERNDCVPCGLSDDLGSGASYAAVGTQVWYTENYNVGVQVTTTTLQPGEKWCYNDDPANCDGYGGMYSREIALEICSDGWKLPGWGDMNTLINYLGGNTQATRDAILDGTNEFFGSQTGKKRHWGVYQGWGEMHFWTTGGVYKISRTGIGQSATGSTTTEGAAIRCIQDVS